MKFVSLVLLILSYMLAISLAYLAPSSSIEERWILLLGSQKTGSTTLWELLSKHKHIISPRGGTKELQFFNANLASYTRDTREASSLCNRYFQLFPNDNNTTIHNNR